MLVLVLQQGDAQRLRRLDPHTGRRAHYRKQRIGNLHRADLATLRFDIDDAARIERRKGSEERALERFLRRLWCIREVAKQRPPVLRDALEVEDLCAFGSKSSEQTRLAAAGQAAH